MKKYVSPLILFILGSVLYLLTIKGVMGIEKLNFLIAPYFIFWMLSLLLLCIASIWLISLILVALINSFPKK
ncbi:hypothetical protein I6N95_17940 [Vagococcus sp. BWB3-3]|uniref:Uncharacterized protein n=1 Tax=Vagococcus allomyrinae TaxID=2794353 RepID=A0A940PB40_9ENTE|nr:hypothetical protein [Vagococcus allomyrinae]MBP1042901.1 hypothetical protein [Vagococcus allomyrinae]